MKKKSKVSGTEFKYNASLLALKRKEIVGTFRPSVGYCGHCHLPANKHDTEVEVAKTEGGSFIYKKMMYCGSVWLCPKCSYKIAKGRASELYDQLSIYRKKNDDVLFGTFTLQHNRTQSLTFLLDILRDAYQFAQSHREFREAFLYDDRKCEQSELVFKGVKKTKKVKEKKKRIREVEMMRSIEIKYSEKTGWHPHIHALFVGKKSKTLPAFRIFEKLFRHYLVYAKYPKGHPLEGEFIYREPDGSNTFLVNEHTTKVERWNGSIDKLKDYMMKGQLEQEMTSGGLKKKKNGGKTFFELIDSYYAEADKRKKRQMRKVVKEYITGTFKAKMFHATRGFFKDVRVKSEKEILHAEKIQLVVGTIPRNVFDEMVEAKVSLIFLSVLKYRGFEKAKNILNVHGIDFSFMRFWWHEQCPPPSS